MIVNNEWLVLETINLKTIGITKIRSKFNIEWYLELNKSNKGKQVGYSIENVEMLFILYLQATGYK